MSLWDEEVYPFVALSSYVMASNSTTGNVVTGCFFPVYRYVQNSFKEMETSCSIVSHPIRVSVRG